MTLGIRSSGKLGLCAGWNINTWVSQKAANEECQGS